VGVVHRKMRMSEKSFMSSVPSMGAMHRSHEWSSLRKVRAF
jgi:hypothetical protein